MIDSDVLDPDALASLEAMTGGDAEFMAELIDTWVSDAAGQIAVIEQALAARDADALRRASHSLKSTSQSLGAGRLASVCAEIEALTRDGRIDAVSVRLADLHHCYEQARSALLAAKSAS